MSSGFISESEILEARRRRQEEWEKVRTEDQPKGNQKFIVRRKCFIPKHRLRFLFTMFAYKLHVVITSVNDLINTLRPNY